MKSSPINIIKYYPAFWFFGLYPLWGLFALFKLGLKFKITIPLIPYLIFFIIQIASINHSFFGDWYQNDRLLPIIHNLFVYLIFVTGISIGAQKQDTRLIYQGTKIFLFFSFAFCIISLLFHLSTNSPLEIKIGPISTKFTRIGYIFNTNVPRVNIFTPYPNASGLLFLLLYLINLISSHHTITKRHEKYLIYSITLLSILSTGSRLLTLFMLVIPFFLATRKQPFKFTANISAALFLLLILIFGGANAIDTGRKNSSDTRLKIYTTSLKSMTENSPIIGLGIKPKTDALGNFPIGSHSSYIGYITKNGYLGLIFIFLFASHIIFFYTKAFSTNCPDTLYIAWFCTLLSSTAFLLEDLDAFELNALLFGLVIGLTYQQNKTENKSPNILNHKQKMNTP